MEQTGPVAVETRHNLKPARRKLQKNPRTVKSFFSRRWSSEPQPLSSPSLDAASATAAAAAPSTGTLRQTTATTTTTTTASKPRCMSMAPDLSDAKWLDYLDRASLVDTPEARRPRSNVADRPPIIPELAHLTIAERGSPQPSFLSNTSGSRRRAKTPVFSIGQLEESARRRHARRANNDDDGGNDHDQSSAEDLAQQYRALLESRGHEEAEFVYTAASFEGGMGLPVRQVIEHPVARQSQSHQDSPTTSFSTSDDGTLVAFQEDAIYFKPISFSPESPAALPQQQHHHQHQQQAQETGYPLLRPQESASRGNLSLDISLGLLSRQLSSALAPEPQTPAGRDASALQVWVMIEAYERLLDQLSSMNLAESEIQGATGALRNWLAALHAVHRSLTDEEGAASESEYEDL